jgi:internalin A
MNEKPIINNTIHGAFTGNFIGGDGSGATLEYTQNPAPISANESEEIKKIKSLLTKLREATEVDSNFSQEQKKQVLEKVTFLEEAVQSQETVTIQNQGEKKEQIKKTTEYLRFTIDMFPLATKFVEECNNLLPLIDKFFC